MTARKVYPVLVIPMVLALVLAGCGVPQDEYDSLEAQLASTQQEYEALQSEYETTQNECDADRAEAQSEIEGLQADVASQAATIDEMESSNAALQKNVSDLEDRLDDILGTEVVKYYIFDHQYRAHTWVLPIPLRAYFHYRDEPRPAESSKYATMTADSYSDDLLNILVTLVEDEALAYNLKKTDVIDLVAALAQSMVHTNRDVRTPYDAYPRYPVETLFEEGGDCEDNSILVAALLTRLDYNVVFFVFDQPSHVALGIDISAPAGYYWEYQAKRYYYLETTGGPWEIGDCPTMYRDLQPLIISLAQ